MSKRVRVLSLLCALIPVCVLADGRAVEVRGTIGASRIFLDEPFHFAAGGSVRIGITERIGVEPQFLYTNGPNFREFSFLGNVTFDLTNPERQAVFYLIGSAGILNERQKVFDFSSNEFTASGGVGMRAYIGKRLFFSPEVRFGTHAFPQVTGSIGWVLSARK